VNNQQAEEQGKALEELRKERDPWFRLIVPQVGQMAVWVQRPEWETFQLYLSALCDHYRNYLERGVYDKAGHDLSDLHRGMIKILKELMSFNEAVLAQKKKQEEESKEKKEPKDGMEQSNQGRT
jgi:hypothetical protein